MNQTKKGMNMTRKREAMWRNDEDYRNKLSKQDMAWLDKFQAEYYSLMFKGEPLHNTPTLKKRLMDQDNAARRDICNYSASPKIERHLTSATRAMARAQVHTYYDPLEYNCLSTHRSMTHDDHAERIDLATFIEKHVERAEAILAGKKDPGEPQRWVTRNGSATRKPPKRRRSRPAPKPADVAQPESEAV